jgi:hypothetical protein
MNKPKLSGKNVKCKNLRKKFVMENILTNFMLYVRGNFHPHPVVGRYYRLSNFWLAKEVNKVLKKELLHQCLLKTIQY